MTVSWESLFTQIAAVTLVMAIGWALNRVKLLGESTIRQLCQLLLYVALPALIFTRMVEGISRNELIASWRLPLMGMSLLAFSLLVCWPFTRLVRGGVDRPTLLYAAMSPNWFYLPVAILVPVFGGDTLRLLLIYNLGFHLGVWTFGVALFRRDRSLLARAVGTLLSPPILSTFAGAFVILFCPWPTLFTATASLATESGLSWSGHAVRIVWQTLEMLAIITVPLSLLVVGAQLGDTTLRGGGRVWPLTVGLALRLALVPACTLALLAGACMLGWRPDRILFLVTFLIMAMPTAVALSQVAELYGGDPKLGGRFVFTSTLISLATVPVWSVVGQYVWEFLPVSA